MSTSPSVIGLASGRGHGAVDRGLASTPRSALFEGRFGRMFRTLPAAEFDADDLKALATAMTAEPEATVTPETENDDEENFGIPAGYTYFGQFIDHDLTFDPASSLDRLNDPNALTDFRTPRLDLDSLYGRDPADQPYLFDQADKTGRKFKLGRDLTGGQPEGVITQDLSRFQARALIGDKRNDENVIVSQLHGLFLRFHNRLCDQDAEASFEEVQRRVRWHYQWLVLFDFLPRICGRKRVKQVLPHIDAGKSIFEKKPERLFFHWHVDPFMPVEFSGAAYRFGHSMVRPEYRLSLKDLPPHGPKVKGLNGRKFVFAADPLDGLNGFREFPGDWAIDWSLYFETRGRKLSPKLLGPGRIQPAYKIDTSLVAPLGALPEFSKPNSNTPQDKRQPNILALRNLLRGAALGLPSGQDVARFMGLVPIDDDKLLVGKANVAGLSGKEANKPITAISARFADNAPLWFYCLAEAQVQWVKDAAKEKSDEAKNAVHVKLGEVGGRILTEVFVGLLQGDAHSFLSLAPNWKPELGRRTAKSDFDRFTMGDLVEFVTGA